MASTIPSVNVSEDNWDGTVAYWDENGNPVYVSQIAGSNPNNMLIPSEPGVYDQKNTGWTVAGDGDDVSAYINGIGYTYADPNAAAAPAPAPAPASTPQMPRMPQMRKMMAANRFGGNFGLGSGLYGRKYRAMNGAGGKSKIVNSLLGGKLTQPGGATNPYGGK